MRPNTKVAALVAQVLYSNGLSPSFNADLRQDFTADQIVDLILDTLWHKGFNPNDLTRNQLEEIKVAAEQISVSSRRESVDYSH